jgi:hypothetical protein
MLRHIKIVRALRATIGLFGLLIAGLSAAPPTTRPVVAERTIAQIAQERFEVADRGYQTALAGYRAGIAPADGVFEWQRRRTLARLDIPGDPQRVQFLRDYLEEASRNFETVQRAYLQGGRGDPNLAKYYQLEAELWLTKALPGR